MLSHFLGVSLAVVVSHCLPFSPFVCVGVGGMEGGGGVTPFLRLKVILFGCVRGAAQRMTMCGVHNTDPQRFRLMLQSGSNTNRRRSSGNYLRRRYVCQRSRTSWFEAVE